MGRLFLRSKYGNSEKEGDLHEIPSLVGVWIFPGTTKCLTCFISVIHSLGFIISYYNKDGSLAHALIGQKPMFYQSL